MVFILIDLSCIYLIQLLFYRSICVSCNPIATTFMDWSNFTTIGCNTIHKIKKNYLAS
jgi:hypothetical protein